MCQYSSSESVNIPMSQLDFCVCLYIFPTKGLSNSFLEFPPWLPILVCKRLSNDNSLKENERKYCYKTNYLFNYYPRRKSVTDDQFIILYSLLESSDTLFSVAHAKIRRYICKKKRMMQTVKVKVVKFLLPKWVDYYNWEQYLPMSRIREALLYWSRAPHALWPSATGGRFGFP